jgi:putative solute:sodium symporter small subunit
MADRSQTGAAGVTDKVDAGDNVGVHVNVIANAIVDADANANAGANVGASGMPPDFASGGPLHDVDWHGAAAAVASRHWRRTLRLVAVLMVIGFVVTFVPQFWAREWASLRFAGWPLPFYMGAQGAILIDIVLIVVYAWMQRRNDARYQRELHVLRDAHRDSLGPEGAGRSRAQAPASSRSASSRAASAPTYR